MRPLDFQGTISVKYESPAAKEQSRQDALAAFNKISTPRNAYLVICHDGSHHPGGLARRQARAGVAAVCNKHWLKETTNNAAAESGERKEELVEEAVGFDSMVDSVLAEEVACSLACDLGLRELKRNGDRLEKGSTVHLILIGDCTEV